MKEVKTILINPTEAMKYLGIARNKMYSDLLTRSDFPFFKIGNKFYIDRELLGEWAKNQCLKK